MRKILLKGLGMGDIDLSISLLRILTTHNFDMGNPGLQNTKIYLYSFEI